MLTQFPHTDPIQLLPPADQRAPKIMLHFVGAWSYLRSWRWLSPDGRVIHTPSHTFRVDSLPLYTDTAGRFIPLSRHAFVAGTPVFANDTALFSYLVDVIVRDLEFRGCRDDRTQNFRLHMVALIHFFVHIRRVNEPTFVELSRAWEHIQRPKYASRVWGEQQQNAIDLVHSFLSVEDENVKISQNQHDGRYIYLRGAPGSGKSAVLTEIALRACASQTRVVIVCPTGQLVYSFKSSLPDVPGIENISVDTLAGLLRYQRPVDGKVRWTPPSALRQVDLILVDEASQYNDVDFKRFYSTLRIQPHAPVVLVVADFQQLQGVGESEHLWKAWCENLPNQLQLRTIYRSTDVEHLAFLNSIRHHPTDRDTIREYFQDRFWDHRGVYGPRVTLEQAVASGLQISERTGDTFQWLTATNRGAAKVSRAALAYLGLTDDDLNDGFPCDPESGSDIPIVARPGVLLRLTRNIDKERGFVNGAVAVVTEVYHGHQIFAAKLVASGNMILVHPIYDQRLTFLPCCYGYATTIRRAQGASFTSGCVWFDARAPAGLGYAYVAISRFRSRAGCHLFGSLRSSDFQPVGTEVVVDRSAQSEVDSDDLDLADTTDCSEGEDPGEDTESDADPGESSESESCEDVGAFDPDEVTGHGARIICTSCLPPAHLLPC